MDNMSEKLEKVANKIINSIKKANISKIAKKIVSFDETDAVMETLLEASVDWDGENNYAVQLPSGAYLCLTINSRKGEIQGVIVSDIDSNNNPTFDAYIFYENEDLIEMTVDMTEQECDYITNDIYKLDADYQFGNKDMVFDYVNNNFNAKEKIEGTEYTYGDAIEKAYNNKDEFMNLLNDYWYNYGLNSFKYALMDIL